MRLWDCRALKEFERDGPQPACDAYIEKRLPYSCEKVRDFAGSSALARRRERHAVSQFFRMYNTKNFSKTVAGGTVMRGRYTNGAAAEQICANLSQSVIQ